MAIPFSTELMVFPPWFPAPKKQETHDFRQSILAVDIDAFQTLSYDNAVFVYRGFIRTAHRKALKQPFRDQYISNRHFTSNFSFPQFTPPWMAANIDCKVNNSSLFRPLLQLDFNCLPRKKAFQKQIQSYSCFASRLYRCFLY